MEWPSQHVTVNTEIMFGTPCFKGTRIPVSLLFQYLAAGDSADVFLGAMGRY
ncbi:MAG: DUF433 domain-containing protein [Fimbriimonadaceae bacterium]